MVGVSRRAVLGGVGAAAAAGPVAAAGQALGVDMSAGPLGSRERHRVASGWVGKSFEIAGSPAKAAARAAERSFQRKQELAAVHRIGGLDPSIACLRSMSPTARARMQIRRDGQDRTLLEGLWNQMFGLDGEGRKAGSSDEGWRD